MTTHQVYIGIGSNIGDRLRYMQEAVRRLDTLQQTTVSAVSSIYMTEPVGESSQNRFYNGVLLLNTALPPEELRRECKIIEQELGRPENYERWSPRVIDLDILLYNLQCFKSETLSIPHRELHRRKFVLVPLLDLANPLHPEMQRSILQLLQLCTDRSVLIKTREKIDINKKRSAG